MRTRYHQAAAAAVVAAALLGSPAEASWNVGGASMTASIAPAPATDECAAPFTFDGEATGVVLNTVFTADIGAISFVGTGCSDDSSLVLSANGVGPTGSTLRCQRLEGTYAATGPALRLTVAGGCMVNNFDTGTVTYVGTLARAQPGPFAGVVQVEVDRERRLIYM